jgi:DedD protein
MFKQKSDSSAHTAKVEPADAVQAARTRARHRLIGAVVLLAIGIIGFPLVFETQPRPVPIDIPIEIPRRDQVPPLAMPQSRPAPPAATARPAEEPAAAPAVASREPAVESRAEAGRDVTPPRVEPARPASAPVLASRPAEAPARASPDDGERARALLEGRQAASAEGTRFVLQVGAFADAEAARDTRKQVEKLGLKTYTQVAQTASGSRIRVRVGPFSSRVEADAALAKAKAAGLAAVVLTL